MELGTNMPKLMGFSLFNLQFFPANNTAGELGQSNLESMVESSRNLIDTVANKSNTKSGTVFVAARRYRRFLQIARGSSIPGMSSVESADQ